MKKRVVIGVILIALTLTGCAQAKEKRMVKEQLGIILTQSVYDAATAAALTAEAPPTSTPAPTPEPTPTATPDAAITITSIQEIDAGRAIVEWESYGNFPSGFALVWTTEQRRPVYPDDSNTYSGDPTSRSALMSGEAGQVYSVRVCRANPGGCDLYSDTVFFTFSK